MLQAFVQNLSSVSDVYFTHILQEYVPNVSSVLVLCCSKFFHVASVLSGCCICCCGYTRMLQVYVPNGSKCFSCFRRMLQVFYLDVAYVPVAIQYVASLCSKLFQTYFVAMLHVASACISRRGNRAQAEVVPRALAVPMCMHSSTHGVTANAGV
jgi:hypothetical protein